MSIEDVLAQQTQMMKMLEGVANAVAKLQTQVPATQVPVIGVKGAKKAPPTSFFGEKGVAEALPKPPEVTDYGVDTGALAVATPDPAGMSQYEAALPAAKENPLYMAAVSKLGNNEPLTPEEQQAYDKVKGIEASLQTAQQLTPQQEMEAALEATKQNPTYMLAINKVGNNEPLTPEEQQAYDKAKGIEASLQAAQQKGGRRKQTKRARKMKPRKTYRKTNR